MVIFLLYGIFFVWAFFMTWTLVKTRNHYANLVSTTKKGKLDEALDEIIQTNRKLSVEIKRNRSEIERLKSSSVKHLQKIGIVRFNPFERSGGEQSFVISLLDSKNTGLIANFIYAKSGLRVYSKRVEEGRGKRYDLSEEEKEAIKNSK